LHYKKKSMTTLFFILTVFYFMYEFYNLINPKKTFTNITRYANSDFWTAPDKSKIANGCFYLTFTITYFIWTVIGLCVATQWYSFLAIFLLSFSVYFLNRIAYNNTQKMVIHTIDSMISVLILFFIFMNHFHPEFGLLEWVQSRIFNL
jgi:hypothetical protein